MVYLASSQGHDNTRASTMDIYVRVLHSSREYCHFIFICPSSVSYLLQLNLHEDRISTMILRFGHILSATEAGACLLFFTSHMVLFIMENPGAVHVKDRGEELESACCHISFFFLPSLAFSFSLLRPSSTKSISTHQFRIWIRIYILCIRYDSYESRPKSSRPPFAFTLLISHLVTHLILGDFFFLASP